MNPGEYAVMARAETSHWWYRGLRDWIGRTLSRPELGLSPRPAVLDAGCGTGETLRFLRDRFAPRYLGGFDAAEAALEHARAKVPEADLYRSDLRAPELRVQPLDLVVSCDAVSMTGGEAAREGLATLARGLRPGGLLLLHLPAYAWLMSEHDVAVHTRERFTCRGVRALLDDVGLEVVEASYRLMPLLPLVVASRVWSLGRRRKAEQARSQLQRSPAAWLDRLLLTITRAENRWLAAGRGVPCGSSVYAVARRSEKSS